MATDVTRSSKESSLLKMFLSMLYISAFTFGGGYVIITFMKKKFVDEYGWIDESEMLDIAALAQSCPGAIAVNAAILVGWKVSGFIGMIIAVFATIIPPIVILSIISFFYGIFINNVYVAVILKGMQAGVAAVILDVVCSLSSNVLVEKSIISIGIMLSAFIASIVFNVNVIFIILGAVIVGILKIACYYFRRVK